MKFPTTGGNLLGVVPVKAIDAEILPLPRPSRGRPAVRLAGGGGFGFPLARE